MKKKSTSQSAFLKLRVLTGLLVILFGVFVALAGLGVFSATAATIVQRLQKYQLITHWTDPLVPVGFDCSKIHELSIDKQEGFRAGAIMIACGQAAGGSGSTTASSTLGPVGRFIQRVLTPLATLTYGGGDVDLITGVETYPHITQSETYSLANPDNPDQILVAYNDSRGRNSAPINISGASVSTDGGTTFTRLTKANGQSPFDNTAGDPVALYNTPTGTWLTLWVDLSCGIAGLGGYKSTSPWDPKSWSHFCIHNGGNDSRESGWSDNNPSSPFFGRMYVSWNDFTVGGGAIFVCYTTDNGLTWTNSRQLTTGFIRDVQITGDMSGNGNVYVAGMDEGGGGFPHQDKNLIFKSTDGGNTWTNTYISPTSFPGPGVCASGYFAGMFFDGACYWTYEGWGEPAAHGNFVHLIYGQHGAGSDAGDVYYIRSTDGGVTFATPFKLNTDSTTRPQWEPNISVSSTGTLLATWYDGREFPSCTRGDPAVPCYRMWSRKSNDNGATWLPDQPLSDVASPLPAQVDPGIRTDYAGDYDYGSGIAQKHITSWVDGRVPINNVSQQDAFTDRELVGTPSPTPTATPTPTGTPCSVTSPSCDTIVFVPPTDFSVEVSEAVDPATVDASDFTVNNIPADSSVLINGNTEIVFHFNNSPVVNPGVQTMHIPAGAFNCGGGPVQEFTCTFTYQASTPTPTEPPPTATPTPTATTTATAMPTATPSATPTATPTPTARPTPTVRPNVTPRPRPTPPPRP